MRGSTRAVVAPLACAIGVAVAPATGTLPAHAGPTCFGEPVTVDLGAGDAPTDGPDVILGTPGPDTIRGTSQDLICAGDGDDEIDTDFDSRVKGGAGDDVIRVTGDHDVVETVDTFDAVWAYGNSYTELDRDWYEDQHYLELAAAAVGDASMRTFGIGATRVVDSVGGALTGHPYPGTVGQWPGAAWPGGDLRPGLVVVDTIGNDIGHYPDQTESLKSPEPIDGEEYLAGVESMNRALLAILSSDARVEPEDVWEENESRFTGTWTTETAAHDSGGSAVRTTEPGASATLEVLPAQSGPSAGRVHLLIHALAAESGAVNAPVEISVGGGAPATHTVTAWERYIGQTGDVVDVIPHAVPIDVPVDGEPHDIQLTHVGDEGEVLHVDAYLIPGTDPNPIAVMGGEGGMTEGLWTQEQVDVWTENEPLVTPIVQSVASEFPNATYVPSTMDTATDLYQDGLHPNDQGMAVRADDLLTRHTTQREVATPVAGSELHGGPGDDLLVGGSGPDRMLGGPGADTIHGGAGNDRILGGGGPDTVLGGDGDDVVRAGAGADVLRGGAGADVMSGQRGHDEVRGQGGDDVLRGKRGRDTLVGGAGADRLAGGRGHDSLRGGRGHDVLKGGARHDRLRGGRGRDRLYGQRGDDMLRGGRGRDFGDGGRGHDTARSCERQVRIP